MPYRLVAVSVVCWCVLGGPFVPGARTAAAEPPDQGGRAQQEFFESHIRPALAEHCYECHSADTEAGGGLLLDTRQGWEAGGDSGAAIVPGQAAQSRLLKAISYQDPQLQMPPDGKLPAEIYEAFAKWIADGAFDPREGTPQALSKNGLPVERAQEHWAYRELTEVHLPERSSGEPSSPIDVLINQRLEAAGLSAAPRADPDVLVRRLAYDLTGLPPEQLPEATTDSLPPQAGDAYAAWIDRWLASPHFGETFARRWMDVARYGESITLRGFVLPEAWRYRDYLVQAFCEDRPFNQMVQEQIAGDLLQAENLRERHMQLAATAFLAMGNTNLEQQDKTQLEMDYVDEQLDVIGRAFLGQTIGCARCHDHKFDPIPTRDYYALAGIMRSSVALKHANLSQWIEQPLPLPKQEEDHFNQLAQQLAQIDQRITTIKQGIGPKLANRQRAIPVADLAGIVVDSRDAKRIGEWVESTSVRGYVGDGYLHDADADKGKKTVTFEPPSLPPGEYRVRLAYSASSNRASNTLVRIFSADGEATVFVNQREEPTEESLWVGLGQYRFEKDGQAFVLVSNEAADGHVIVDAVQFLPLDKQLSQTAAEPDRQRVARQSAHAEQPQPRLLRGLRELESQRKALDKELAERPRYLTIVEESPPKDLPIHIRGDVHQLGSVVPRGFLSAISPASQQPIQPDSSGRLELAQWLASDRNALTARVYANRVWYWLMGQGLVTSLNNFGTTGTSPSHPELLDWLAAELIRSGWSTKHLVRQILLSDAYRRSLADPNIRQAQVDPANRLYWQGHSRRLTAESLRDSMLSVSGELDLAMGGSLIRPGTKADYDYAHLSTRRSVYQPVFRNSLPALFEAFDFADSSVSVGQRARSTVATQALVLVNHPWVAARAAAAAARLRADMSDSDPSKLVSVVYQRCLQRQPTATESAVCVRFLADGDTSDSDRLQTLIHSLFASLDFRYLD